MNQYHDWLCRDTKLFASISMSQLVHHIRSVHRPDQLFAHILVGLAAQLSMLHCRAQQGSSGVQSVRLGSNELKAGTYFFAFFNMDYFVHQTYQFIFLVSMHCTARITLCPFN